MKVKSESEVAQSCLTPSDPMDWSLPRLIRPWDFPGKSTGVGCHCLLQALPKRFLLYQPRLCCLRLALWGQLWFSDRKTKPWDDSVTLKEMLLSPITLCWHWIPCVRVFRRSLQISQPDLLGMPGWVNSILIAGTPGGIICYEIKLPYSSYLN